MAFKSQAFDVLMSSRGRGGLMLYADAADTLTTIKGANYFNEPEVRAAIAGQRDNVGGTAANNPVACLVIASNGMEIIPLVMADNGNVALRGAPNAADFLIT